jgi:glycosyltransferase involved in cell wall biosynthesis
MARRRILYLHQHFSTPDGTTATRSHAQARALAQRGHAVTLACGRWRGAETGLDTPFRRGRREGLVDGIRIVEFDIPCANAMGLAARSLAFGRYAARAAVLALRGDWDLIIASSTPLTVALPALLAEAARGTPFLFEIRDPWPELPAALGFAAPGAVPAMRSLARAACRRAEAVVALSDGMAETALAHGAAPERVSVVPQGCDLDLFGPHIAPWRPPEATSHEALALYAGTHGAANGLAALIEAAAELRWMGERRVRLLLVGEGSEKARLMRAARQRGLDNVTFLDPLPKRQLAALLAGSQMALLCLAPVPAFAEWTAPNKLMDALAAGRPVVSNLPGATARLLAETGAGLTAPDAAGLARAMAELATHATRREAMGRAARAAALRHFDRRRLTDRFAALAETSMRGAAMGGRPVASM